MPRRALLALVLAAGLVAVLALLLRGRDERAAAPPSAAQRAGAERPAAVLSPAGPVPSARAAAETTAVPAEGVASGAPAEAPPGSEARLAELRGRLLLEGGAPAAGVALRVHGWSSGRQSEQRFGPPPPWQDLVDATGADGRFALRFDPPRAFQFVLDAKLPGHAEANWRWSELPPGELQDLGDVLLVRGGALDVRIVDAAGRALTQGWSVYAEAPPAPDAGTQREAAWMRADMPSAEGVFHLADLPQGAVWLEAQSDGGASVRASKVEVRAGETVAVELRYTGPDLARRIMLQTTSRPFYVAYADPQSVRLYGAEPEGRTAGGPDEEPSDNYAFDGLPDGEYRVDIDDPKFLPWSQDGVRPGSTVHAWLKGSAALVVEVVDGSTGAPIPRWTATLRFERVNFNPREFELVKPGAEPPSSGLLDGIVPGDFTLLVQAQGYAPGTAAVDALAPGEVRRIPVSLGVPGSIAGVVRYADGGEVPLVDVELAPHAQAPPRPEDPALLFEWRADDVQRRMEQSQIAVAATADERGAFAFEGLAPGAYDLSVQASALMSGALAAVTVEAGSTRRVVLEVPARSYLSGACRGPDGAAFEGLWIVLEPKAEDDFVPGPAEVRAEVDPAGTYRVGPVPPGSYLVQLRLPDVSFFAEGTSVRTAGPPRALDTVTLEAGENPGHDYDVRALFPGRLRVRATSGPAPATGWRVRPFYVRDADDAFPGMRFVEECQGAALDAQGEAVLSPLFPGEYVLVAEGADATVLAPEVGAVPAGGDGSLALDVATYPGTLLVLDAESGQPLADQHLTLLPIPPVEGLKLPVESRLRTDSNGRVAAQLAPGPYVVLRSSMLPAAFLADTLGVPLAWYPDGPVPPEVRLKPAQGPGWPAPAEEQ